MSAVVFDRRNGEVWKVTAFKASCRICGDVLPGVFVDMPAAVQALKLHVKNTHDRISKF